VPPCLRISAAEPFYQGPQQYQVRIVASNPLYLKHLDLFSVADPGCLSRIQGQKDSESRICIKGFKYFYHITVKWGKSEHLKFFKVVLKLFSDGFSPFFLQKSWYQKFYFLFQDLTDTVKWGNIVTFFTFFEFFLQKSYGYH
jgi:hypothetical protein